MKKIFLLLPIFLSITISIQAEEMKRIAMMNLQEDGVSRKITKTISHKLRKELVNANKFTVIKRKEMKEKMEEEEYEQTDCTEQECAVEIGKLLSASKVLIGDVKKVEKGAIITIRIVDVENGVPEYTAKVSIKKKSDIDKAVDKLTKKIVKHMEKEQEITENEENEEIPEKPEKQEIAKAPSALSYYMLGFIPGAGQFYAGSPIQGTISAALFVSAGVLYYLADSNYRKKKKAYDDLDAGLERSEYNSKYDAYKKSGLNVKICLYTFIATYALNWIDILLFTSPDYGHGKDDKNAIQDKLTFNMYNIKIAEGNETETRYELGWTARF